MIRKNYLLGTVIILISFFSNEVLSKDFYGTLDIGVSFNEKDDKDQTGSFGFSLNSQMSGHISSGVSLNYKNNQISLGSVFKYDMFSMNNNNTIFGYGGVSYDRNRYHDWIDKNNLGVYVGLGSRFGGSGTGFAEFKPIYKIVINPDFEKVMGLILFQFSILLDYKL